MKKSIAISVLLLAFGLGCSTTTGPSTQATPNSTPARQVVTTDGKPATAPMTREEGVANGEQQEVLKKIAATLKEDTISEHFQRGQLFLMAGEKSQVPGAFEEAAKDFDWILSKDPKHLGALSSRGMALARTGQMDKAMADFKAASEVNPEDDYPLVVYASILAKTGKDKEAIEVYDKAIALNGKLATSAMFNRGNAHLRLGSKAAAKKDFETVAKTATSPELVEGAKMNLEALK